MKIAIKDEVDVNCKEAHLIVFTKQGRWQCKMCQLQFVRGEVSKKKANKVLDKLTDLAKRVEFRNPYTETKNDNTDAKRGRRSKKNTERMPWE